MPVVELLFCCPMNEILTCCKTFLSPCDRMIPPLASHLHFPHVICAYMYVCCHCDKCKGKLVPLQIMWKHCQAELKNQTVSEQNEWKCLASSAEPIADWCRFPIYSHNTPPVLHLTDPSTTSCSPIQQEVLNSGANTSDQLLPITRVRSYTAALRANWIPIDRRTSRTTALWRQSRRSSWSSQGSSR